MDKNSKIYIAGHTGLVGSALCRILSMNGYKNIVIKELHELDLRNQQAVEAFFAQEKPEYVFLAAAKVGGILANSMYKAEFIYDNLMIAANVIHASYKYGVKKLLNLGSSCIYPKNAPQPLKEEYLLTGPLEQTNEPYAIAKIAALKLCRYYNEQYGTNFISLMPTNLYGPYDNFNLETAHVLPALIRKFHLAKLLEAEDFAAIKHDLIKRSIGFGIIAHDQMSDIELEQVLEQCGIYKTHVQLWGTGEVFREFLYVDDLAQAALFFMKEIYDSSTLECINIGTGKDITIKGLACMIREVVGWNGHISFDKNRIEGTPRKVLSISCATGSGWHAITHLQEGLIKTYQWYCHH